VSFVAGLDGSGKSRHHRSLKAETSSPKSSAFFANYTAAILEVNEHHALWQCILLISQFRPCTFQILNK
jgi:hypothetical protein